MHLEDKDCDKPWRVRNAAANAKVKMEHHFKASQAITRHKGGGRDSAGVFEGHLEDAACDATVAFRNTTATVNARFQHHPKSTVAEV